jgi:hypothetical protein
MSGKGVGGGWVMIFLVKKSPLIYDFGDCAQTREYFWFLLTFLGSKKAFLAQTRYFLMF